MVCRFRVTVSTILLGVWCLWKHVLFGDVVSYLLLLAWASYAFHMSVFQFTTWGSLTF